MAILTVDVVIYMILFYREVIDFCLNNYGKIFVDFLINTNMCILNGRGSGNNDFTSVSTIGNAVVDY